MELRDLEAATREFARQGCTGAGVDEIASLMRTTKRMIYYCFGYCFDSEEQLCTAVLEHAYAEVRGAKNALDVDRLGPVEAVRTLAEPTFDHHDAHPDSIRLVGTENTHRAEHVRKSPAPANLGTPALGAISRIGEAGRTSGDFVASADAIDVHMVISAFRVVRIADQHTFEALFGHALTAAEHRARHRRMLGDTVAAYLTEGARHPGPRPAA
ncbi:TetR/AcrR family transcriptional regulator [Streptomyces sp. NPDC003016]